MSGIMAERHQMFVETMNRRNDPSVQPERLWVCPQCGKRMVMGGTVGWLVLDRGDEHADHYGSDVSPGVALNFGIGVSREG